MELVLKPPMPQAPDRIWENGKVVWEKPKECPNCKGEGYTMDYNEFGQLVPYYFCEYCKGRGIVKC